MPNCSDTKYKCGVACTVSPNNAWYKDCKTGHVGTGATYGAARTAATVMKKQPCAGLTGATWLACASGKSTLFKPPPKITPSPSFGTRPRPPPKPLQFSVRGGGGAGITPTRPTSRITPRRITGTGRLGVGPSGTVRTPPIDLRPAPITTTTSSPISTIQDQVASTPTGTWIIIGLAVVVLIIALGGR